MNNFLRWAVLWLSLCFVLPAFAQTPATLSNGGFDKSGRSTDISASNVSSSVALPTTVGQTLVIMNTGATNTVYVQLGNSTVVATAALGLPVLPLSTVTLAVGGNTHIAGITSSSTTTVVVMRGSGVPAFGGGPVSAGGGTAVTVADGADVAQGTTTDAACATDNGTCTELALIKRANQRLTTMIASLAAPINPLGITPTDRTIASTSGASQQIAAANAARHGLTIVNTGNANCGVNPTGGTAAIGGAGTLTLAPLGSYSPRIPTLSAITVICTAAQPIYAEEN